MSMIAALDHDLPMTSEEPLARQERAERVFWRDALMGAALGMVICAGLWMLIVAVALIGAGWSLGSPLAMAAGVGVFAGAFLGGWCGVMVGAARLESVERSIGSA
jgi:hypothetical protein